MNRRVVCPLLLLSAVVSEVSAQAPGYPPIDPASIRAEYTAEVLVQVNRLLADWGNAWALDQVDDLTELYWEDGLLVTPEGSVKRGRDEIRDYFGDALHEHGHIEAFMLDFDASGGMAQVYGNYMLGIQQGEEAGTQKSGPMMTVYVQRGRRWRIRSQLFLPGK